MGLPTGLGMALSMKNQDKKGHVYVLIGEAECQEGTTWESLLIASQHKLNNLTGIIDKNNYQGSGAVSEIISLGDLEQKLRSFGAEVRNINGHCHEEIIENLNYIDKEKPTMIIANTIKGKGVKIMEQDQGSWHAKFPNQEQLKQIYEDLGGDFKEIKSKIKFPKSIDLRKTFGETLVELAESDDKICLLAGDYESGINKFKEKFPERYINLGTTEQSMISLASGMAIQGLKPVVYSITPFILERPFEQVKIGLDQQKAPVILVGFDDYPDHGPTHNALNAQRTAKLFLNMKSYFPKDSEETKFAIKDAYNSNKPCFIRLQRDYQID
jgi:transketolase